ncbi:MAG: ABC transporter permease [Phycisphaerales bacterium]
MTFLLEIMRLGLSNLRRHKLRSMLTALGIILGVAAVITNASIGEGSKRAALEQIERLGAKNIIIRSQLPADAASSGARASFVVRFGLTREDVKALRDAFPDAEALVPLKEVGGQVLRNNIRRPSQAYGTTPELLGAAGIRVDRGRYLTREDLDERELVCVIGSEVARVFFPYDDPLGSTIRLDAKTFRIVGVLAPVGLAGGAGAKLVGRDLNLDVHIPLTTANEVFGDYIMRSSSGSRSAMVVQISEVYLVAPSRELVTRYAELARRVIDSRKPGLPDVAMIVPYELLEQAKRVAMTWTLVLLSIAGISLLVGGIGIMNIMLASVTERTREIGIRRALGATRRHIVYQFIVETGVLSVAGGIIGVGLGVGLSMVIAFVVPLLPRIPGIGAMFAAGSELPTRLNPWSILVAFVVAALTGLVFGLYPAIMASKQDPIVALRHD